jgi:hypothetical protein
MKLIYKPTKFSKTYSFNIDSLRPIWFCGQVDMAVFGKIYYFLWFNLEVTQQLGVWYIKLEG